MQSDTKLHRRPGPATRPFSLLFVDGTLWTGSWDTERLYAMDPNSWTVLAQYQAPGKPFGIANLGGEFRVVISDGGEADDRYFYRFVPGQGFDLASKTPCPDMTGSYLALDGTSLYLGQMTERRILELDTDGTIKRTIALPTRCAGFAVGADRRFYMTSGDSELENLQFGTLNITAAEPQFTAIAPLPDGARSLAFDGSRWWTCLRDEGEIASFAP